MLTAKLIATHIRNRLNSSILKQAGQDGRSDFYFNLVPSYLQLPGGQDALIVRSVNGTSWASVKSTVTTPTI